MRIGIDVGGTFTDAVAIDSDTYELVGQVKVLTTHDAPEGVARGIVESLGKLLKETGLAPEQVRFIAHGTTQATNALLEGDVVPVGIVATGTGFDGLRARQETRLGHLQLAPGKWLRTVHTFTPPHDLARGLQAVLEQGAQVIVAAEAFSVDDPTRELEIMALAGARGVPATGSHEISKLYGLRIRTRTAVVNASILPRMMDTADMTETSVRHSKIGAPLMIMRGDGGVMTLGEVRRRPILTMLSGPAAGVAGALMYEKVSHGIFLEVGGTSTDISAVKNGRVMVEYAEVGGHKTYVTSLDVRTVGLAGGSMVRVGGGRVADVGPRSAHIAGLPYAAFTPPEDLAGDLTLERFAPRPGDPDDYIAVRTARGRRVALTTTCAANVLGYVSEGAYARGNAEAARLAFTPLARALNSSVESAARQVLEAAAAKVAGVVSALLQQYEMERRDTVLVGGGGGAAAVVPFLAERMAMAYRLARNHQVISPIGVALALVRDVVERTIPYPSEADVLRVRREAEQAAIRAGAAPGTVQVQVEVDSARQVVRGVATGAVELRTKDLLRRDLPVSDLEAIAARSMGNSSAELKAQADRWYVYTGRAVTRLPLGLRRTRCLTRVLDAEGVIRLSQGKAEVAASTVGRALADLEALVRRTTVYGDAGEQLPATYLFSGGRMTDLSGLQSLEQILAVARVELNGCPADEPVAIVCAWRR